MRRREVLVGSALLAGAPLFGCGGATPPLVSPAVRRASAIHVIDSMPEFFGFWDAAQSLPAEEACARFLDEIVATHRDVYAPNVLGLPEDAPDAALVARIDAWLPTLREREPTMRRLQVDFESRLDASRVRFLEALPEFDWAGNVYLIASIDAFNGASRMVGGESALVFGIDVIARMQPDTDLAVLFHHELFHMDQAPAEQFLGEAK